MNKISIFFVLIFISVSIFLYKGLHYDPKKIESPLIGKTFPEFKLTDLYTKDILTNSNFLEKKTIVNVWASWCLECEREHSYLIQLSKNKDIDMIGINYKDDKKNAIKFIEELGNPFKKIGTDNNGRSSMVWGVYGVPETFIIHNGTVIYKHIGPIHMNELEEIVLPILGKLL